MDIQIPDQPISPAPDLPSVLLACLLRMLDAAMPTDGVDPDIAVENREAARAMFFAMQPCDPLAGAAAVRTIATHFACMDLYARAARPGLSAETVLRLRAGAVAAARACEVSSRMPKPPQAAPAKPTQAASPPAEPAPAPPAPAERPDERFTPRDRFGKPIPRRRTDLMTRAQVLATLAYPRDPDLEQAAVAEEQATIAEQAALDAKAANGPPA